jgi:hypothetical protein
MVGASCALLGLLRCARTVDRYGAKIPRRILCEVALLLLIVGLPAHAADPRDFAPGQLWSIKPGTATTMRVIVGRVEPLGERTVVHVSVIDIAGFPDVPGLGKFDGIGHMPFDSAALAASVDRLLASDAPPARDFEVGYSTWKANQGGVFTVGVPQAVDATYRSATQKGT